MAKLQLGFEALIAAQGFDALALSCWPRFQVDPGMAVCSLVGQLNTLSVITACEGDVPSAVGMLALNYFTNGDVVTQMDLVSIDPADDSALLWHCGPTSPRLAGEDGSGWTRCGYLMIWLAKYLEVFIPGCNEFETRPSAKGFRSQSGNIIGYPPLQAGPSHLKAQGVAQDAFVIPRVLMGELVGFDLQELGDVYDSFLSMRRFR